MLADPIQVTITADINPTTGDLTTWKINDNTEKNSTVTVENHTGATLPETGAMGTVIFSVLGVVLVIGGTLMLGRHRKKND